MIEKLPDIQNTKISSIQINRVGVTRIDFPLKVGNQTVSAKINLYGSLPKTQRGTNMSRYIEILMEFKSVVMDENTLKKMLYKLLKKVETKDIYADIEFKYYIDNQSPVSKKMGVLGYDCFMIGRLHQAGFTYILKLVVPVTSVCPCSKHISKYGAHNQRGYVTTQIQFENNRSIPIEDLISLIEAQGSCPVYSLLKRPDEKWVTEHAYQHPKFVEDIARDVSLVLQERKEIRKFRVKVENFESIHSHNACAYIFRKKKGDTWVSDMGEV